MVVVSAVHVNDEGSWKLGVGIGETIVDIVREDLVVVLVEEAIMLNLLVVSGGIMDEKLLILD